MDRTKDHPDVIAAWQRMVEAARAFVRCADEFSDDIGATAEHYDALERAQEHLARAWDGQPVVHVALTYTSVDAQAVADAGFSDAYASPPGVIRHG